MATRGWQNLTPKDLQRIHGTPVGAAPAKKGKYRNIKTTVNGIVFDSVKESERYLVLKMRESAGEIRYLERQPKFDLSVGQVVIGSYVADFRFEQRQDDGRWLLVIEDVKGMDGLPLYKWKVKHLNAQYGYFVTEIR